MDDFIILTKTRHQLRKAVKLLNTLLSSMGFKKHPDKTFIGRISKGFDWMGGWLTDKGITGIAPRALQNHLQRSRQLYEQTRNMPAAKQAERVSQYRKRWWQWAVACVSESTAKGSNLNGQVAEATLRSAVSMLRYYRLSI